jgi:hypothetical protein
VGVEAWPIGWKTKTADKPLAELFNSRTSRLRDPGRRAIAAIQARQPPFLFDWRPAARIDPAVQADVPEKWMTYSQILGKS